MVFHPIVGVGAALMSRAVAARRVLILFIVAAYVVMVYILSGGVTVLLLDPSVPAGPVLVVAGALQFVAAVLGALLVRDRAKAASESGSTTYTGPFATNGMIFGERPHPFPLDFVGMSGLDHRCVNVHALQRHDWRVGVGGYPVLAGWNILRAV
jgi:hypothetical protein